MRFSSIASQDFQMATSDEEAVDVEITLRVRETIKESQQQIVQQMNSLFTKISDQRTEFTSNSVIP